MTRAAVVPRHRATPPAPRKESTALRTDIQTLRALAVSAVMLYHLWPNRLTGGYVGVDVFFAISGFLITSHLLGEVDRTGRLRPAQFWARRAKRLVPASTIVLLVAAVGTWLWAPDFLRRQFFHEIGASALQFQNWLLAHNAVDYLASTNPPSPTQHFWTLAVEEQFYVGLPILILLAIGAGRLLRVAPRRIIGPALGLAAIASLWYSISLTHSAPGPAYFSTFTRAWEFAAGAALAFVPSFRWKRPGWLALAGVAAIVVACVTFDAHTVFPGYAAALPVLGAVLAIWAGRGSALERLGELAPVALLGRVSYALYLWHWPMIVLAPYALGHPLGTFDKIAIIVVSIAVSWLSTRFVEDPIRFNPRLLGRRRPRVVVAWAGAAIVLVLVLSTLGDMNQKAAEQKSQQATRQVLANAPRCLGAAALDPALAPCDSGALGDRVVPAIADAPTDRFNAPTCWRLNGDQAKLCHLGPATGYVKKLYAVGDSHNISLVGAWTKIAQQNNWRIDVSANGGCYYSTALQPQPTKEDRDNCASWRASVTNFARTGGYDAFIMTHSDRDRLVQAADGKSVEQTTVDGLVGAWNQLPNVPIIALRDNPSTPDDTLACVAAHEHTAADDCRVAKSEAVRFDGASDAAKRLPRVRVVDMTSFYCVKDVCPPVIGNVVVYQDHSHPTATFVRTLVPYLNKKIVAALNG